ncbi:MAG TPA: UbiD family decarboxylase, partial [Dehalococcoidia bacterium]|nr:UbiD family decarboxylase [Dehalococcoidia bacterium]
MAYKDLREYIRRLEEDNELSQVDAEVDWDLEIGAISRRTLDLRRGALLFNRVKGYPEGYRVLANLMGPTQPVQGLMSLALGFPKNKPVSELIDWFSRKCEEYIRPVVVDWAPCKENILKGDEVDLLKFPVPRIHGIDGGRYMGTWHIDVIKDPDTGWVNWATYRHMLHDQRRLGWLATPAQQGPALYYEKYEARGEPMPMAVAIGPDPVSSIAAFAELPPQVNEVEVAGALQGEPIRLVKCETVDLEVPASAEIVLEGYVPPRERAMEGPFGEFTGYNAGGRMLRPVFHVQCVTFRNDPILTMSNMGKPWDENAVMSSVMVSAMLAQELRKRGIRFRGVYAPPPGLCPIVAADPRYAGFIHTVASAFFASKGGGDRPYLVLVGQDVDPTNLEDVFWCLFSRLHPDRGVHVLKGTQGLPLLPFLSSEERRAMRGAKLLLDATFPPEWPPEEVPLVMDFEHGWPQEIREEVLARWD